MGNYSFGFLEQLIFPEICYDDVDKLIGINISIIITIPSIQESVVLLIVFGVPFQNFI